MSSAEIVEHRMKPYGNDSKQPELHPAMAPRYIKRPPSARQELVDTAKGKHHQVQARKIKFKEKSSANYVANPDDHLLRLCIAIRPF